MKYIENNFKIQNPSDKKTKNILKNIFAKRGNNYIFAPALRDAIPTKMAR